MDFEKQYTDDDYANKAGEANATGQILYVLVTDEESDGAKKKVGNLVLAEQMCIRDRCYSVIYNFWNVVEKS